MMDRATGRGIFHVATEISVDFVLVAVDFFHGSLEIEKVVSWATAIALEI